MKAIFLTRTPIIAAALWCAGPALHADEVFSGIAGFVEKSIVAARDTYVSVPVRAGAPAIGEMTPVGNETPEGAQELSVSGQDGWTTDELMARHSIRVLEGPDAGRKLPVITNDDDSLFVRFDSGAPSPGTSVALEKEWTLDTLFPPATQDVFHESDGVFAPGRKSELLVLSPASGSGPSSAQRVYFLAAGVWRESGGDFRASGADRIPVDAALVIRHPASVAATTWLVQGIAYHGPVSSRFVRGEGETASRTIGLVTFGGTSINRLELGAPLFRLSDSGSNAGMASQLRIFGVTLTPDPAPLSSHLRTQAGWVISSGGNIASGDTPIPSGTTIAVEEMSPAPALEANWTQPATP